LVDFLQELETIIFFFASSSFAKLAATILAKIYVGKPAIIGMQILVSRARRQCCCYQEQRYGCAKSEFTISMILTRRKKA